jgi:translation initiation factor 1A
LGKKKVVTEDNLSNMVLPKTTDVPGMAMKLLGNDRIQIKCQDGYKRICRIRGKMKG